MLGNRIKHIEVYHGKLTHWQSLIYRVFQEMYKKFPMHLGLETLPLGHTGCQMFKK